MSEFKYWKEKYECREKEFERRMRAYETARQRLKTARLLVDLRNAEQSKSALFYELPWWDEGSPVPLENKDRLLLYAITSLSYHS